MNRTTRSLLLLTTILSICLFAPLTAESSPVQPTTNTASRTSRTGAREPGAPPALTVILVVDQLRSEQLTKNRRLFLPAGTKHNPGGFNFLMENGADHRRNTYNTMPTHTAPGHAIIITGAPPTKNGIIANSWYDRKTAQNLPAIRDDNTRLVGAPSRHSYSPANLIGSTIGDELKLATNGLGLVYSVSLKDRASILLGGKSSDLSLWFDSEHGQWVTSTWYLPQGQLPNWVARINQENWCDKQFNWVWDRLLAPEAYRFCAPDGFPDPAAAKQAGLTFPSPIKLGETEPNSAYRKAFITTPLGNTMTLDMAATILHETKLGRDDVPDLLTINLASYDRIGHAFGPNSQQLLDTAVRLDRDLANFLRTIDRQVGLDNTLFVLTADHGCAPQVAYAQHFKLNAGTVPAKAVKQTIDTALATQFGEHAFTADVAGPHVYLNHDLLSAEQLPAARRLAQKALEELPGVSAAYTREEILTGQMPQTVTSEIVARSYHRTRSGDLFLVLEPFWIASSNKSGGSHGLNYAYDTQVPLIILGQRITPGERFQTCHPQDISATVCTLLNITSPSGCEGRVLDEDIR